MAPKKTSIPDAIEKYIRDYRAPIDFTRPADSPMVNFYRDKCVFLTGGTGFLGQLFVEKLLRTGVRRIYVLARPKKGRSSSERLAQTFTGDVFNRLHAADPLYMERVRAVDGDMGVLRLGIADADWAEIRSNVQIVLHSAAEVRFDETLQHLLLVNLRGTREVLRLAEELDQLEVFVHISTAYSHCPNHEIAERFYETPLQPEQMIQLAEGLAGVDQHQFRELSEKVIQPWPNTYTFTKALAEELVRGFGERIPLVVMRPSIVISTNSDPIPGWINNIYGLTGVLLASGMGFQRVLPYKEHMIGDFVCADFVINSTLAAAWVTHLECQKLRALPASVEMNNNICDKGASNAADNIICASQPTPAIPEPKIYHVISYQDRPITYKEVQTYSYGTLWDIPSEKSLWLPSSSTTNWRAIELVYIVLYHVIPALAFDAVFWATGSKFRLMPMYRKAHKFMLANAYFMTHEWAFANSEMKSVYAKMTLDDRRFFPSDVREYNFRDFISVYCMGIRLYVVKESEVDEAWARTRLRLLRIAHCGVLIVLYSMYALLAYLVVKQCGYWDGVVSVGQAIGAAVFPTIVEYLK